MKVPGKVDFCFVPSTMQASYIAGEMKGAVRLTIETPDWLPYNACWWSRGLIIGEVQLAVQYGTTTLPSLLPENGGNPWCRFYRHRRHMDVIRGVHTSTTVTSIATETSLALHSSGGQWYFCIYRSGTDTYVEHEY